MRTMRAELSAMRSVIDGGFHMARDTDGRVEGLRCIVDSYEQRITSLERHTSRGEAVLHGASDRKARKILAKSGDLSN